MPRPPRGYCSKLESKNATRSAAAEELRSVALDAPTSFTARILWLGRMTLGAHSSLRARQMASLERRAGHLGFAVVRKDVIDNVIDVSNLTPYGFVEIIDCRGRIACLPQNPV